MWKDAQLFLTAYPEPPAAVCIDQAARFAASYGIRLSVAIGQTEIPVPANSLVRTVLDVPHMVAEERAKCVAQADSFAAQARKAQEALPERGSVDIWRMSNIDAALRLTQRARAFDLTLLPVHETHGLHAYIAEHVIFGSGRPVLLLPQQTDARPAPFRHIAVAWDFGRAAARALADALPLLRQAETVDLLTIDHDKEMESGLATGDVVAHLQRHGVQARAVNRDGAGRATGQVLTDFVRDAQIDLLVMGAFGHSRLRDFILGGATKSILSRAPVPVLLSH